MVRTLHETQRREQEWAGGEVDAVVHPGGHSYPASYFPCRISMVSLQAAARALLFSSSGFHMKILIAEDDLISRNFLLLTLEQLGHENRGWHPGHSQHSAR